MKAEIKLPTYTGSQKKQENTRDTSTSVLSPMLKPLTVWKILQEDGIRDHLTCFLRNLYADQEATVRPDMEQRTGSILGKEYIKAVYCQCSSVAQSCPTLCDPMDCSTPGLPVHHQLPKFTQTHVHRVGDAIQPSYPLSPLLLLPSVFPSIRVFSNESVLHIRWPKY